MAAQQAAQVRPFQSSDYDAVLALAPRLAEGVAPWRDSTAVLNAVHGWVTGSVAAAGQPGHAVYVAISDGRLAGFVTVGERTHFTGQVDAYVGELVVTPGQERQGIASQLVAAAESWAARNGFSHLTLDTGAANQPARGLYAALGYQEEDVRLTKAVPAALAAVAQKADAQIAPV